MQLQEMPGNSRHCREMDTPNKPRRTEGCARELEIYSGQEEGLKHRLWDLEQWPRSDLWWRTSPQAGMSSGRVEMILCMQNS